MSTRRVCSDTDWLAFQYAAGELNGRELAEFESRLADDETAQHAVEQMVELSLAVSAARPAETAVAARSRDVRLAERCRMRRRLFPLSACLAVLAAVLLACWLPMRGPAGPTGTVPGSAAEDPVRLAIAWSETRAELESPDPWQQEDTFEASGAALLQAPAVDDEPYGWPVAETPPWVWAAVTTVSPAALDDEPSLDGATDPGEI